MAAASWKITDAEIAAIVEGRHGNPFAVLGLHRPSKTWIARAFVPGAETLSASTLGGASLGSLEKRHGAGFFEGRLKLTDRQPLRYSAGNAGGTWEVVDAYQFGPVLGPLDDYYLAEGTHLRLYDKLGAHLIHHEGLDGVHFAVWAPNASRVSVVGDFNNWDGRLHVMRKRLDIGVWEIFVPLANAGCAYKYELLDSAGGLLPLKSDPFGQAAEMRPDTASCITDTSHFEWRDSAWLEARGKTDPRRSPMTVYEVHLGSWKRTDGNGFLSYDELAADLVPYAASMGFTHIELLPIT